MKRAKDTIEFIGTVQNGRLSCSAAIATFLQRMEGQKLVVRVSKYRRTRSLSQNRYYFGVVVQMIWEAFCEAGNTCDKEDVHCFLKQYVGGLRHELWFPDGRRMLITGSSAGLQTLEFENYLEKVRAWAAETLGLVIPLPNEVLQGDYFKEF